MTPIHIYEWFNADNRYFNSCVKLFMYKIKKSLSQVTHQAISDEIKRLRKLKKK
jgi:hypothetical protein